METLKTQTWEKYETSFKKLNDNLQEMDAYKNRISGFLELKNMILSTVSFSDKFMLEVNQKNKIISLAREHKVMAIQILQVHFFIMIGFRKFEIEY